MKLYNLSNVSFSIKDKANFEKVQLDENKILINDEDYIKISDKKTRDFVLVILSLVSEQLKKTKNVREEIYNIAIPKSNIIRKKIIDKAGINEKQLNQRVMQLENEINGIIYELYGVNKKEIAIIGENLKK